LAAKWERTKRGEVVHMGNILGSGRKGFTTEDYLVICGQGRMFASGFGAGPEKRGGKRRNRNKTKV